MRLWSRDTSQPFGYTSYNMGIFKSINMLTLRWYINTIKENRYIRFNEEGKILIGGKKCHILLTHTNKILVHLKQR